MIVRMALDFISPYAFLGWRRARRELVSSEIQLEPMPVLFAALLNANETKGPAEIPSKRLYTWKHVLRLAHGQGLVIAPPPSHPFNPLLGLRVVACTMSDDDRVRTIDALFDATWGGGGGIATPQAVLTCLNAAGLPGEALVEQASDPAIKQQIKDNTTLALALGVFGVPSFIVNDEVFWGQDSLPHLAAYLKGEDPVDPKALQRWADLPVGAARVGATGAKPG
ncbi:MAG: 2-hydroxychromene-2-carboxylate isomerase [Nannocystaceae bacterium]|nr:2-hydroxychromene-2-carboxylate isomerase [Nannocystaceae bacterium]